MRIFDHRAALFVAWLSASSATIGQVQKANHIPDITTQRVESTIHGAHAVTLLLDSPSLEYLRKDQKFLFGIEQVRQREKVATIQAVYIHPLGDLPRAIVAKFDIEKWGITVSHYYSIPKDGATHPKYLPTQYFHEALALAKKGNAGL